MCAWLVESFPAQIRLTSVAVGYNIAQISGGVIPALATLLADDVWLYSPGFYVTFIAFLSIHGLYSCPPRPWYRNLLLYICQNLENLLLGGYFTFLIIFIGFTPQSVNILQFALVNHLLICIFIGDCWYCTINFSSPFISENAFLSCQVLGWNNFANFL